MRAASARTVGLQSYQYDANGNLLTGGGRSLTWDSENRVASVTATGVTETSTYDADGERVTKVNGALTTVYLEGVLEEVVGGAVQLHYAVGGMLVAVRDSGTGALTYLHSDHLGSVSLATTNSGSGPVVASEQMFTPWGEVRAGGIGQTTHNYTGQRLDGSGLLYYHARYYDPVLARFISADSVVPGSASGSMDGVALKPLTVDFHEPGFAATLAGENAQPFWFQMSGQQRQQAGYQGGPLNPQALNRYSYVLNNPVRGIDPSGHVRLTRDEAITLQSILQGPNGVIAQLQEQRDNEKLGTGLILVALGGAAGGAIAGAGGAAAGALGGGVGNVIGYLGNVIDKIGFDPHATLEALTFFQELSSQLDLYLKWSADPRYPERANTGFNFRTKEYQPMLPPKYQHRGLAPPPKQYTVHISWGGRERSSMEIPNIYPYLRKLEWNLARRSSK